MKYAVINKDTEISMRHFTTKREADAYAKEMNEYHRLSSFVVRKVI